MDADLVTHCNSVALQLRRGKVVFVLGAGINLVDRVLTTEWSPESGSLPTGTELARHFASKYLPGDDSPTLDLARMAEWIEAEFGPPQLEDDLHALFDVQCDPTRLHTLIASIPKVLESEGNEHAHQFIITTNYDDVLERAFRKAKTPFDLLVYIAGGRDHGRVRWFPEGKGSGQLIRKPNGDLRPGSERSVILKIHGAIDRKRRERDSWVITENDYIEYLTHTDTAEWLPTRLNHRLKNSNLECLGYSLRDWNLRAILRRLRQDRSARQFSWWAVQLETDPIDRKLWEKQQLTILNATLEEFVEGMRPHLSKDASASAAS